MSQSTSTSIYRPVVAIMTDFGPGDGDVGVMKGIIAGIAPQAHIIDITHEVAPQNIVSGAWILGSVYRYFPRNTVYVCVVDPGVGSSRGAIAMHAGEWFFVGPDNGLFSYILQEQAVQEAMILNNSAYHLSQVSSTFHGRDIFAPVGAHLARGVPLRDIGAAIDPTTLQRIDSGAPVRHGARIDAYIVHVDHFGNLISNIPLTMVPELFSSSQAQIIISDSTVPGHAGVSSGILLDSTKGKVVVDRRRRFFAEGSDDGQPFIYGDSSGYVGIAVRNGSAARALGAGFGTVIAFVTSEK